MQGSRSGGLLRVMAPVAAAVVALATLATSGNAQQSASIRATANVIQVAIQHQVTDSTLDALYGAADHKSAAVTLSSGVRIVAEAVSNPVATRRGPLARPATAPRVRRATIAFVAN